MDIGTLATGERVLAFSRKVILGTIDGEQLGVLPDWNWEEQGQGKLDTKL